MKKKRFYGCLVLICFSVVVLFGCPLISGLLDRIFIPWAFESGGRPPLTGSWAGVLTTATERQYGVILELRLPEPEGKYGTRNRRGAQHGELAGTARICDERGKIRSYTIEGEAEDRQATRLFFYTTPVDTPVPEGLTPNWVNGGWDGANNLALTVEFHWEQDGAAISGDDYPETQAEAELPMTRGGEAQFRSICSELQEQDSEGP